METIKLKDNSDAAIKVELNDDGDYILLAANSATFFDNYVSFLKDLTELSENSEKEVNKLKEQYEEDMDDGSKIELAHQIAKQSVTFSEKATKIVDDFLGENTTYKYFKVLYEGVKDFMPGEECFADLISNITPVIEKVYGKKIEIRQKISKSKTEKYVPQDFKKKGNK